VDAVEIELLLSPRHKLFADNYLKHMDATKAAELSGYKCKTRQALINKAYRLKNRPDVKQYINYMMKEMHDTNMASLEETMKYLSSAMRGKEKEQVVTVVKSVKGRNFDEKVKIVEIQIKPKDRINASKAIVDYYKEERRTNPHGKDDKLQIVNNVPFSNKKKVNPDADN